MPKLVRRRDDFVAKRPYEARFNEALDLWHNGDGDGAIGALREPAESHPREAPILGMLGGYLHDLERHQEALPYLTLAVTVSPASVTLFHILCALNRETEAWSEASRPLALRYSEEYDRLLSDIRRGSN